MQIDDFTVELLFKTSLLHDIGKIGVPDHVLLKAGPLTDEEFAIMRRHCRRGAHVISIIEAKLGQNDFLRMAKEITLSHHERWDGSGYPQGLAGQQIPLSARLMAVADVYDALTTRRVYKPAFPHTEAVKIIREKRGSHFDPVLVDVFLEIEREFQLIARRFSDEQPHDQARGAARLFDDTDLGLVDIPRVGGVLMDAARASDA